MTQWCWHRPVGKKGGYVNTKITHILNEKFFTSDSSSRYDMTVQELEETACRDKDGKHVIRIRRFCHWVLFWIVYLSCFNTSISIGTSMRGCYVLFGLSQSFQSVSSVTPSVIIASWKRLLLFARIARTSDMGRRRSTTVRIFWRGGRRICN